MQTSINMEKSARSLAQREMILQMMGMVPRYHPHQMPPGQQVTRQAPMLPLKHFATPLHKVTAPMPHLMRLCSNRSVVAHLLSS